MFLGIRYFKTKLMIFVLGLFVGFSLSKLKQPDFRKRLLLLFFGLFLGFIIIEIFLPIFYYEPKNKWTVNDYNVNSIFKTNEYSFVFKTNNQGLREPRNILKNTNKKRIVCVGNSGTFGWAVNYEDAYPHQLQEIMKKKYTKNLEVINMGHPGGGIVDYLCWVRQSAVKLSPDIILVGFWPGNDMLPGGVISPVNRNKIYSKDLIDGMVDKYIKLSNRSVKDNIFFSNFITYRIIKRHFYDKIYGGNKKPLVSWISNDRIVKTISEFYKDNPEGKIAALDRYLYLLKKGWFKKSMEWTIPPWLCINSILQPTHFHDAFFLREETQARAHAGWDICKALIREIKTTADRFKIKLGFVIMPHFMLVEPRSIQFRKKLGYLVDEKKLLKTTYVINLIEEFFKSENIPYVNSIKYFRKKIENGQDLIYPIDGHPNQKGYRYIAELVEQDCLKKIWAK